jgi:hypothetical protein
MFVGHLESFLVLSESRHLRSVWLRTRYLNVYVRRGMHVVGTRGYQFLDVANVTVEEQYRRQNLFSGALRIMQDLCPWDGIFVQNVHSPILRSYLSRLQRTDPRWVATEDSCAWIKDSDYHQGRG